MYINPINKPEIKVKKSLRRIQQEEKDSVVETLTEDAVELTNFPEADDQKKQNKDQPSSDKPEQKPSNIDIRA